jgi:hypothetical protein
MYSKAVQTQRHRCANFGKVVLNDVGVAFPNWHTSLRRHAQELQPVEPYFFRCGQPSAAVKSRLKQGKRHRSTSFGHGGGDHRGNSEVTHRLIFYLRVLSEL